MKNNVAWFSQHCTSRISCHFFNPLYPSCLPKRRHLKCVGYKFVRRLWEVCLIKLPTYVFMFFPFSWNEFFSLLSIDSFLTNQIWLASNGHASKMRNGSSRQVLAFCSCSNSTRFDFTFRFCSFKCHFSGVSNHKRCGPGSVAWGEALNLYFFQLDFNRNHCCTMYRCTVSLGQDFSTRFPFLIEWNETLPI